MREGAGEKLTLGALLAHAGLDTDTVSSASVTGVSADSRQIRPGSVFVAVRGTQIDGHDFVADAVRHGAIACVVERPVPAPRGVPVIVTTDTRRALAELAAALYGHPGRQVPLIGITGTVGKTSVLSMLETILVAAGRMPGTIGSLGVRAGGRALDQTVHTTPDAARLQEELAAVVHAGSDIVAMEVTSHALMQQRVHGLEYALGIFTNLLPLEHEDYHGSFRAYVEAKSRFFDHLAPCAPLIHNADDRAVRALVRQRNVHPVGCSFEHFAAVRLHSARARADRTTFVLRVRRPLPRLDGGAVEPLELPLSIQVHGGSGLYNAALAATAALCAGASPDSVQHALALFPAPPRRMQVVHRDSFTILDDTVGHPDSVSALFRVLRRMRYRRLHVVFAVRGRRGTRINHQIALSLGIWSRRVPISTLVVTSSVEATDDRNRVSEQERAAFVSGLRETGASFTEEPRLQDAVERVLAGARSGDLVLLLGAQGMDQGARIAREWMERNAGGAERLEAAASAGHAP